jgi:hypothetical protein
MNQARFALRLLLLHSLNVLYASRSPTGLCGQQPLSVNLECLSLSLEDTLE